MNGKTGKVATVAQYCKLQFNAAFSNANDKDKTAVVKAGKVVVDGIETAVNWIENFTDGSNQDGSKTIVSVEDKIGGKVSLSDKTVFENPVDTKTSQLSGPIHCESLKVTNRNSDHKSSEKEEHKGTLEKPPEELSEKEESMPREGDTVVVSGLPALTFCVYRYL